MLRVYIASVILFYSIFISYKSYANDLVISPEVEIVSSGPIMQNNNNHSIRHRLVAVLSEVYLELIIETLEYGEENCCVRITGKITIDSNKLAGKGKLFNISDIHWTSYNEVMFTGNSSKYIISNLDKDYQVKVEK